MSGFASTKDLAYKVISFHEPAPALYGCTAEGGPDNGPDNGGFTGGDSVPVVYTQTAPDQAASKMPWRHSMTTPIAGPP
ncbi:MAG: hypothetical protein ACRYHQ_32740 [Janthinobacterium lividum]